MSTAAAHLNEAEQFAFTDALGVDVAHMSLHLSAATTWIQFADAISRRDAVDSDSPDTKI